MTIAVISMIRDSWGGSEELWYQMAKEALQKGHRVLHLGYEHPEIHSKMQKLQEMGLQRFTRPGWVPTNAGNKQLLYLGWNYLRKKFKNPYSEIFKQTPDIIIYNGTCYSIRAEKSLVHYIAKKGNTSCKFYILGQLNNEFGRGISDMDAIFIRHAYQLAKKVFFVSQRNLETARRHLCSPIHNGEIIRNPVNMSSIEQIPIIPITSEVNFALVGNLLTSHKGQDIILQALAQWQEKAWFLNIYGKGADQNYLENLVNFLGLQNKIRFHGSVSDIRMIWKQNHILLMPSLMEGMPLAVVEAMLCCRICIATDIGGHTEWINHGKNGFIATAPTITALTKALDQAWEQKDEWDKIAANAHETAKQLFDPHAGATLLRRIIAK